MEQRNFNILLIILSAGTLTQICTDIYLPSLPSISNYFNVGIGQVQLTMSLLILGVAVSGLVYGPLSEVYGRQKTLLAGIAIAMLGSMICFIAPNIFTLQIGRLLQGCGLGACSALWRSIFRDTYSGDEMARIGSYLANVILISVILAPFLGGYIEHYGKWQYTFAFMLVWSFIVLILVAYLYKETNTNSSKKKLSISYINSNYRALFRSFRFMGFTLCSFLTYGGLFAWLTAGPAILIKGVGISPIVFGWLSIITGLAMALGGTVNGKFVKKIGSYVMMQVGWLIMITAGIAMLVMTSLWSISVITVLIPGVIFIFGSTLIFANAFANAFEDIGHIAGFAGGVYSGIQLMGGALFSAILSHINSISVIPLAILFICSGLLSWGCFRLLSSKRL